MLTITRKQFDVLAKSVREGFAETIAAHLATRLATSNHPLPVEELRSRIREAVNQASLYGIDRFLDLQSFAAMSLQFGPAFHLHPPIVAVLTDARYTGEEKLNLLLETISLEDWLLARKAGRK